MKDKDNSTGNQGAPAAQPVSPVTPEHVDSKRKPTQQEVDNLTDQQRDRFFHSLVD
jgi:hypothetical protein